MADLPAWVRVGVKVVCVDASPAPAPWCDPCPMTAGGIYTIREVRDYRLYGNDLNILVREVSFVWRGQDLPFAIERFRPLVDDSDEAIQRDVALFTEHLRQPSTTTTREGVDA